MMFNMISHAESATSEDEKDLVMELKTLFHVGQHRNLLSLVGASVHQGAQSKCSLVSAMIMLYYRQAVPNH